MRASTRCEPRLVMTTPALGDWRAVQPGLLWLRMPLPFALDHVNLYLIEDVDGWFLVDTGIEHPTNRQLLERTLSAVLGDKRLKGVLVTHHHPDHLGAAGWLVERWGGTLWVSELEHQAGRALQAELAPHQRQSAMNFYHLAGIPPEQAVRLVNARQRFSRLYAVIPTQFRPLTDGQRLPIDSGDWRVRLTSGHSPAHASIYSERRRVLISGDQVLPFISPNVSVPVHDPDANPLRCWLDGLNRLQQLPEDTLVLPAHGHPFKGLRLRLQDLLEGHAATLERIVAMLECPLTAAQVSERLFPKAPQGVEMSMAIGETLAHLNFLVEEQVVECCREESVPLRYKRKPPASVAAATIEQLRR